MSRTAVGDMWTEMLDVAGGVSSSYRGHVNPVFIVMYERDCKVAGTYVAEALCMAHMTKTADVADRILSA